MLPRLGIIFGLDNFINRQIRRHRKSHKQIYYCGDTQREDNSQAYIFVRFCNLFPPTVGNGGKAGVGEYCQRQRTDIIDERILPPRNSFGIASPKLNPATHKPPMAKMAMPPTLTRAITKEVFGWPYCSKIDKKYGEQKQYAEQGSPNCILLNIKQL